MVTTFEFNNSTFNDIPVTSENVFLLFDGEGIQKADYVTVNGVVVYNPNKLTTPVVE